MACKYHYQGKEYSKEEFYNLVRTTMVTPKVVQKYKKILFPSGNTASVIEGHTTLEEFKKEKENRIKKLEEDINKIPKDKVGDVGIYYGKETIVTQETIDARNKLKENKKNEINQLKQELERVEREGFGALRHIYNFYENTVTNILNKQFGKENVKQITDEYGNTWNEVEIKPEFNKTILFQLERKNIEDSTPKEIILNTTNTIESLKQLRLIQLSFEDDFARGVMIGERESQKNYLLKYLKSEKAVDYVINYAKENDLIGEQLEKVFLHMQANLLLNKQDYLQAINKFSQKADQKLDQKLKDFLKDKLNVNTVFDFNGHPGGVIAAADILNKQLTLFKEGKLDTIAEETGHFFFESISKENDIYFKLLDSVETWNGYSKVYEDYKNTYFKPNGDIDVDKIKREAIGQAIGQGIVRNFKAEEGNAFFKALQEVLDQIKHFLNLFKIFNFDVVIDDIAKEILNNDISRITNEYNSEGFEKKNAIDKSKYPIISKIIDGFKSINAGIVGSLSYREYGDLYREVDEDVHDIDVTIPYSQYKGDIQAFFNKIKEQFPDFRYNYRDKKTQEIATWKDDYNDNIIYQIYIDDMPIDLFFESQTVKEREKGKKSWYDAFVVKYNYRRPKDMFDILNWANFEQANLNNNPSVFYQKETIKPGVEELFDSNPELANEVYSKILTNSGISGENLLSLLLKDNIIEKQCS